MTDMEESSAGAPPRPRGDLAFPFWAEPCPFEGGGGPQNWRVSAHLAGGGSAGVDAGRSMGYGEAADLAAALNDALYAEVGSGDPLPARTWSGSAFRAAPAGAPGGAAAAWGVRIVWDGAADAGHVAVGPVNARVRMTPGEAIDAAYRMNVALCRSYDLARSAAALSAPPAGRSFFYPAKVETPRGPASGVMVSVAGREQDALLDLAAPLSAGEAAGLASELNRHLAGDHPPAQPAPYPHPRQWPGSAFVHERRDPDGAYGVTLVSFSPASGSSLRVAELDAPRRMSLGEAALTSLWMNRRLWELHDLGGAAAAEPARAVTLPEAAFLAFRRAVSYLATRGASSVRQHQLDELCRLGRELDEGWVALQPEYGPGLNSPEGPAVAREKPKKEAA